MTGQRPLDSAAPGSERTPARSSSAVQRTRIPDQIASRLIRQIVEGDLEAGTLLPTEAELVREYAVGKSAVREAVRIVSTKGLVEVVQGSGMRVTPRQRWRLIDPELVSVLGGSVVSIVDLMELRSGLEPEIAAHAATRAGDEQIEKLEVLVTESASDMADTDALVNRDLEFHMVLAEAAHNPLYVIVLGSVAELQIELRRKVAKTSFGPDHGIDGHRRIVEALRKRDPEQAREEMSAHLNAVADDLRLATEGS